MGRTVAMVGLLLAVSGLPAFAQQSDKPSGSTAGTPSSEQPKSRNRLLIDVIKTVVPPLIDAATAKPKPAPAEQPAVIESATATAPEPEAPGGAEPAPPPPALNESPVTPASLPQPVPVAASPAAAPPPPEKAPVEDRPPSAAAPAPPSAPIVQPSAPPAMEPSPTRETMPATAPTVAQAVDEAVPSAEPAEPFWPWGLLGLALVTAAAAAYGIDRTRRIARTRNLLSLVPRLETPKGQGISNGLSLNGPGIAVRARLRAGLASA